MTPCFALFAQIGQVESMTIITERDTDQSKGFAVVDMGDETLSKSSRSSTARKSVAAR